MLIKAGEFPVRTIKNMMQGEGAFIIEDILTAEQMCGKGRLFAVGTLMPDCSVGYHIHTADFEVCYFLSGTGEIREKPDGEWISVRAGDATVTGPRAGHAIRNNGDSPLVYLAVVLYN